LKELPESQSSWIPGETLHRETDAADHKTWSDARDGLIEWTANQPSPYKQATDGEGRKTFRGWHHHRLSTLVTNDDQASEGAKVERLLRSPPASSL
jgi:hypothetical protein